MNDNLKAHLALLGANLFYGAGFTVAKTVMPSLIQPNGFIFIRVISVTILFWLSYMGGENFKTTFDKKDWKTLFFCALFGVASNQLLFFKGLSLTSPIHASLMMLLTPILVSVLAAFILKERFSGFQYIGLVLGIGGATMLVMMSGKSDIASNPLLGDFFILLNASSYAIYLVIAKPLMTKYRPIIVIRWIFLIGSLMVFPFGIQDVIAIEWWKFSSANIAAVIFIVIGVTFFTYLWNIYALKILSPAIAGAYIYLQPLFAALIAIFFLHEHVTPFKIAAAVSIFIGVYLVNKKRLPKQLA